MRIAPIILISHGTGQTYSYKEKQKMKNGNMKNAESDLYYVSYEITLKTESNSL